MLSPAQLETWSLLFGTKYSGKTYKKMVNSFATKLEYTVHYRNLAFYCSLGVKATLARGYKFRQGKFIAPYVNLCTSKRKEATDDFDKDIWMLGGFSKDTLQKIKCIAHHITGEYLVRSYPEGGLDLFDQFLLLDMF